MSFYKHALLSHSSVLMTPVPVSAVEHTNYMVRLCCINIIMVVTYRPCALLLLLHIKCMTCRYSVCSNNGSILCLHACIAVRPVSSVTSMLYYRNFLRGAKLSFQEIKQAWKQNLLSDRGWLLLVAK